MYLNFKNIMYYFLLAIRSTNCGVKQLINGAQSKVPPYLGMISVCVCLLASVVSLGLAFLIVPRQVAPWTGFLLMYEWIFTIFFILFGGYLNLMYHWGKIRISHTPSSLTHPESSDEDSGKGMFCRNRAYLGVVFHLCFQDFLFLYLFFSFHP